MKGLFKAILFLTLSKNALLEMHLFITPMSRYQWEIGSEIQLDWADHVVFEIRALA